MESRKYRAWLRIGLIPIIILVAALILFIKTTVLGICMENLSLAPTHIETFKEIAVIYNHDLPSFYNKLTPQERVFIYYMFRASLPGNRIASNQLHRDALMIKEIFEEIINHQDIILQLDAGDMHETKFFNAEKFIQEAKIFLVYLWSNHSIYFAREHANHKRTPERLGLTTLTIDHLDVALHSIGRNDLADRLVDLEKSLFDYSYEPTVTVPNSIDRSAVNLYSPDFTDDDYLRLSTQERDKINGYFYIESSEGKRIPKMVPYSCHGKYAEELSVSVYWLKKAHAYAQNFPEQFDGHLTKSLELLIMFLESGDEHFFKEHSIEWLKSASRVGYNFGFIETYEDPKAKRGFFQAETTIRTIDLAKLNSILPQIEEKLPLPKEFKRDLTKGHAVPNASIDTKVFGMGGLGPMLITAAYCLPNYEDIRSTHGSKQIIYPASKCMGALINPSLSHKLFFLREEAEWLEEHDADWNFFNELWDIQCILHETIGHGSGMLANHTLQDGESLTISSQQYAVGQTIAVTHDNLPELLHGYEHTIEELRAEIIALYVSTHHLEELLKAGFLASWKKKIGIEPLRRWLMFYMADSGLRRIIQQNDTATEISGDHARANTTIMNYIAAHGGLEVREEVVDIEGFQHSVIGMTITDMNKAMKAVELLMQEVQRIKSTGDGIAAQNLIDTHGRKLNQRYLSVLKANEKTVSGDLKARVYLSPHFKPISNSDGELSDVQASWPTNIFEQIRMYSEQELSTEL